MKFLFLFLIPFLHIFAATLDFTLYKKEGKEKGNTLLIIGGIHGNEPGGYFAPSFLEKYYKIKKGAIWIVPNLNFDSIIANRRGIYGDMNRKFSKIEKSDKDYKIVTRIKKIILDKKIDLVLNLHDGHGFYRKKYENAIFNPNAWGQATIIDQEKIHGLDKFGNLDEIAQKVGESLNSSVLFEKYHSFGVKNTQTRYKDEQQQLSLTFFSVTHNKPAFAIETSKNITDLTQKVIYQLKSIEEFMSIMDIEYEKTYDLSNYKLIKEKVYDFEKVNINDNISLDLKDIKKNIRFLPMKRSDNKIVFSHNLGAFKKYDNRYEFFIGHKKICDIFPQYFDIEKYTKKIKIIVDGEEKEVNLSDKILVEDSFKVKKGDFRVNIIGFSKKGISNEDEILIKKDDISKSYSIDKNNRKFRLEFYKDDKFLGMIIINFKKSKRKT